MPASAQKLARLRASFINVNKALNRLTASQDDFSIQARKLADRMEAIAKELREQTND